MKNIYKFIIYMLALLVTTYSIASLENKIDQKEILTALEELDGYTANNDLASIGRLLSPDLTVTEVKENKVAFIATKDEFLETLQGIKDLTHHKVSRKIISVEISEDGLSAIVQSSTSEEFWVNNMFVKGISNEIVTLVKRNGKLLINNMTYEIEEYSEEPYKALNPSLALPRLNEQKSPPPPST